MQQGDFPMYSADVLLKMHTALGTVEVILLGPGSGKVVSDSLTIDNCNYRY